MSDNPYEPPRAGLDVSSAVPGGSIEATLAGDSVLDIGEVIGEAWKRTKGIKRILLLGLLIVFFAVTVAVAIVMVALGFDSRSTAVGLVVEGIIIIMVYPFFAGVMLVGIRQSVDIPVSFRQLFGLYTMALPIFAVAAIQTMIVNVGLILFVLPGLYFGIAFSLAIPLKAEKDLGIVESLATSLKLVNKQFLPVAALLLLTGIAMGLSVFTIIGPIWTIPWSVMVLGIIYRQLAGVSINA